MDRRPTFRDQVRIAGLPEFTDPLQFSRRFDESPFNGLFALYDRGTGTMILHLHNG